jgi:hypothetical protein
LENERIDLALKTAISQLIQSKQTLSENCILKTKKIPFSINA